MCKKLKFDHTNKCYMQNPASILENDTHKLWHTNGSPNLGQKTRHNSIQQNKSELAKLSTCCAGSLQNISERKWKKDKYLDLAREFFKKYMDHEADDYTNCDWWIQHSSLMTIKGTGGLGGWRKSGDHPNYSIVENGQNTEKSPGDLRRLAVTQNPVKDHQPTLKWKTLEE